MPGFKVLCNLHSMTVARRRNCLTAHFSESIPVVNLCVFVLFVFGWKMRHRQGCYSEVLWWGGIAFRYTATEQSKGVRKRGT